MPLSEFSLPQAVADKIGKLVMDKFTEIIVGQASQHSRRKVLAGIVMTTDGATMDNMEVISVTTGTKCINGEHMSVNGNSLNGENGLLLKIVLEKKISSKLRLRKHYLFGKVDRKAIREFISIEHFSYSKNVSTKKYVLLVQFIHFFLGKANLICEIWIFPFI